MHCAFGKKFTNIMLPWSKSTMYQHICCPKLVPNSRIACFSEHSFTRRQFLLSSDIFSVQTLLMCHSFYMFTIHIYPNSSKILCKLSYCCRKQTAISHLKLFSWLFSSKKMHIVSCVKTKLSHEAYFKASYNRQSLYGILRAKNVQIWLRVKYPEN